MEGLRRQGEGILREGLRPFGSPDVDTGRYSRQVRVRGIGEEGQQRLARATVLIVGTGALGTHTAETLARAGVGTLWLCDRDVVEWSNLQRQSLFREDDARAGTPKAVAAANRLAEVNSTCEVVPMVADCTREFLELLPRVPDLVVDGTDNFPTRYLVNDFALQSGIPWVYGGAVGTEGAAMFVLPHSTPCLRCLWPEPPQTANAATCETAGILEPAIAAVTSFQSAQALKYLAGGAEAVTRGVFTCDVWRGTYHVWPGRDAPDPACPACSGTAYPALDTPPPATATLCGRDAVQVHPRAGAQLDLDTLARQLAGAVEQVERTEHLLRFTADGCRFSVFPGGRALLSGVRDVLRARALYDRWIGL